MLKIISLTRKKKKFNVVQLKRHFFNVPRQIELVRPRPRHLVFLKLK